MEHRQVRGAKESWPRPAPLGRSEVPGGDKDPGGRADAATSCSGPVLTPASAVSAEIRLTAAVAARSYCSSSDDCKVNVIGFVVTQD